MREQFARNVAPQL